MGKITLNPYRNSMFRRSEGKTDLFLYHSTSAKNTSAKPSPAIAIQGHSMVHNVVASIKDATVVVEPKCYVSNKCHDFKMVAIAAVKGWQWNITTLPSYLVGGFKPSEKY